MAAKLTKTLVNILGFMGHTVFVITIQLCCDSMRAAIDKQMSVAVFQELFMALKFEFHIIFMGHEILFKNF